MSISKSLLLKLKDVKESPGFLETLLKMQILIERLGWGPKCVFNKFPSSKTTKSNTVLLLICMFTEIGQLVLHLLPKRDYEKLPMRPK